MGSSQSRLGLRLQRRHDGARPVIRDRLRRALHKAFATIHWLQRRLARCVCIVLGHAWMSYQHRKRAAFFCVRCQRFMHPPEQKSAGDVVEEIRAAHRPKP